MRTTVSKLKSSITRFRSDARGSMASLFAIASAGVFLTVGASVDFGQSLKIQATMTGAADAASLVAAKLVASGETNTATIKKAARDAYDANFLIETNRGFKTETFDAVPDFTTNAVKVTAGGTMPTAFMGLAGIKTLPINIASTSQIDGSVIEISMMLDLTGSMEEITADKKGKKITVLEAAAKDLVKTLLPATGKPTQDVRISLAPFSAGVNAGSLAAKVSGGKSASCVLERASGTTATDASPIASPFKKGSGCPTRAVMPLTDDRAALLTRLDKLTTGGTTAGHLGTAWAFGLLSPVWSDVLVGSEPASYGDKDVKKIAILMTDGLYNTWGGTMSGANVAKSMAEAVATCTAMKSAGITVYAVGFELADADAKKTLKDCASVEGGAPLFFDAKNGAELLAAYKAIANQIQRLRLSV
ncbi:vWA domain-containing protein [Chthonobacter albigriseus]|uniref:vWA domain-containing protein n=1 Tax=Chthonobacter albigriseus TaxID=1683161 RepID=UPI0015EF9C06|nr:VWA domain-containing protein [Chthonobacter albigriseus]